LRARYPKICTTAIFEATDVASDLAAQLPGDKALTHLLLLVYQECLEPRLKTYWDLMTLIDGQRPNVDFTFQVAEGVGVSAIANEPLEETKEGKPKRKSAWFTV
jgi:hypothetical protein